MIMVKNMISLLLLIISVAINFKHAWDTFHYKTNQESVKMMANLGISEPFIPFLVVVTVAVGVLLLIPNTFFLGNILNAFSIALIMGLALRAGDFKMALIEIPFLAIPLIMIWL